MILENITVSLEWARKLKKAGWPQKNALYYWWLRIGHKEYELSSGEFLLNGTFAAPVSEELFQKLPKVLNQELLLQINSHGERWSIGYWNINEQTQIKYQQFDDSLSNTAASMYCFLSSQNLL